MNNGKIDQFKKIHSNIFLFLRLFFFPQLHRYAAVAFLSYISSLPVLPPDQQQLQTLKHHSQLPDLKTRGSIVVITVCAPKDSRCIATLKVVSRLQCSDSLSFFPCQIGGALCANVQG